MGLHSNNEAKRKHHKRERGTKGRIITMHNLNETQFYGLRRLKSELHAETWPDFIDILLRRSEWILKLERKKD